jgi:LAS superfamily LD-carboxypeptidase LdcB
MPMNELELTGRARTHVLNLDDPPCTVHVEAAGPLLAMRAAARAEGIDLVPASSFRDFAAQLRIWQDKFHGRRPLYDRGGQPLDPATLTEPQILEAILTWSALPGASRHHWGTEVDVLDRAALAPGQSVRLLPDEYAPDGPFARLTAWLDHNMDRFGFFRPYRTERGGVAPEPWHLSYAPVSQDALEGLTEDVLRRTVLESAMDGKEAVLARIAQIHGRYVLNVDPCPPTT